MYGFIYVLILRYLLVERVSRFIAISTFSEILEFYVNSNLIKKQV